MANYHVFGNRKDGYSVLRENASRESAKFNTQRDAEAKAKVLAGNTGGGEVKIHGVDGKIRDSDTVPPGRDLDPPEDKKH